MQFNGYWNTCTDLFARVFLFVSSSLYITSRESYNMFPYNQHNWISARSITLQNQSESQHTHNVPPNLLFCGCVCNRSDALDNFHIRNRILHIWKTRFTFHRSFTNLKLIQPCHWCSDKTNTLDTARLVMPQRNGYTLGDKWKKKTLYHLRADNAFHSIVISKQLTLLG